MKSNQTLRHPFLAVAQGGGILLACWMLYATVAHAQEEDEAPEPYHPMVETAPEEGPVERNQRQCLNVFSYVECDRMLNGKGQPGIAAPPKPDVWGALAVSPTTLASGTSWNYKTEVAASAAALQQCRARGGSDCKVSTTVTDVCVSLAVSNADKVYAVGGPIGAGNFADDNAMLKCRRAGGKACAIQASFCADGQRHELQGHTEFSNGNPIFVPNAPSRSSPTPTMAAPGDDTAKFYGTWTASFTSNGQTITVISTHDASGYRNVLPTPTGNVDAGSGSFTANNGAYRTGAAKPNDSGTYRFLNSSTVICTNAAGQTLTWKRQSGPVDANTAANAETGYVPPATRPGVLIRR